MKSLVLSKEQRIGIGENRIKECEERRAYFAEQYKITGKELYKHLAEDETDTIECIRQAIIEELLK